MVICLTCYFFITPFSVYSQMEKMQNIRLRLLSYVVIAYMLIAFSWWSILLYTKNQDAFLAKTELLYVTMIAEGRFVKNPVTSLLRVELLLTLVGGSSGATIFPPWWRTGIRQPNGPSP